MDNELRKSIVLDTFLFLIILRTWRGINIEGLRSEILLAKCSFMYQNVVELL